MVRTGEARCTSIPRRGLHAARGARLATPAGMSVTTATKPVPLESRAQWAEGVDDHHAGAGERLAAALPELSALATRFLSPSRFAARMLARLFRGRDDVCGRTLPDGRVFKE